jgi:hypothetical protein
MKTLACILFAAAIASAQSAVALIIETEMGAIEVELAIRPRDLSSHGDTRQSTG